MVERNQDNWQPQVTRKGSDERCFAFQSVRQKLDFGSLCLLLATDNSYRNRVDHEASILVCMGYLS